MSPDLAALLHIIGFLAAIAIYAMLVVMVWRAGVTETTRLPFVTGCLGLTWNLGGLWMFGLDELGLGNPPQWLDAIAYTALGFLPAVVVHSVLRVRWSSSWARWLTAAAYALSALAGIGHFWNLSTNGFAPLPLAQHTLTPLFGALILPLALLSGPQTPWRRALWMLALAVFAVSGTELAYHADGSLLLDSIGHHASMLLAVAILYQDYRFALADLFLKRALEILSLVIVVLASYVVVVPALARGAASNPADPRVVGPIVALWVATALCFPVLRRGISWLVDTIVLRRDSYGRLLADIQRLAVSAETSAGLLTDVCDRLQQALNAAVVQPVLVRDEQRERPLELMELEPGVEELVSWARSQPEQGVNIYARGAGAVAAIPTAEPPSYVLVVGRLSEGRRLTAEDASFLESISLIVARRIDHLRIVHERYEHELREREMQKLASQAELRALRAQINPHFLFNALTTIGHLIQTAPDRALETLVSLTDLLRRVLSASEEETSLGRELELIGSYLEIERARFEERLESEIAVDQELYSMTVPTLILQPLVENAVKHGIAPRREGGRVVISARVEGDELVLLVEDTGGGMSQQSTSARRRTGVGLRNVEERLRCHYGDRASLDIQSEPDKGTRVCIRMPANDRMGPVRQQGEIVEQSRAGARI